MPYAFSYFSWGIPYYSPSLVLETSAVLTVFETLKNIDFQGGNSHF